ncbi:MAG: hypothetical protein WCH46_05545 [bacterium]
MLRNTVLLLTIIFALGLSSCEKVTAPRQLNATFTDSTLFVLSEGLFGNNNAELDGYSLKKDVLQKSIISPLGDVGNDIQIIGNRLYVLLENSNKILSVNPDSTNDRFAINFPNGSTPYNMAKVSETEIWVSELTSKNVGVFNPQNNSFFSIPIDTSLAYLSIFKGKAYLLTNANMLEVLDVATWAVLGKTYMGDYPAQICIDTARNSLLVLIYGDASVAKTASKIFWVDPTTYKKTDSVTIASTDFANQMILTGTKAFLTFGDRLGYLNLDSHTLFKFNDSVYYKGIYDPFNDQLILGKGSYTAPGNVDIVDATTGAVKKTFGGGLLPGHFAIYRK